MSVYSSDAMGGGSSAFGAGRRNNNNQQQQQQQNNNKSTGSVGSSPSTVTSPEASVDFLPSGPLTLRQGGTQASPATAVAVDAPDLAVEFRYYEILELRADGNLGQVLSKHDLFGPPSARAVEFTNVDSKHAYRCFLIARNRALNAQRIRITPPQTRAFTASYTVTGPCAKGLDVPIEIVFRIPETASQVADQFTDALLVRAESGSSVSVPLRAFAPAPKLEFTTMVNFGAVVLGNTVSKTFEIVNSSPDRGASVGLSVKTLTSKTVGAAAASHALTLPLTLQPSRALLAPAGIADKPNKVTVKVTIDASHLETGSYRSIIVLDGPGVGSRVVDVVAEIVDHAVQIVYADGHDIINDSLDFGALFYGQRQTVHAVVVNNGPTPVTFQLLSGGSASLALDEGGDSGGGDGSSTDTGSDMLSTDRSHNNNHHHNRFSARSNNSHNNNNNSSDDGRGGISTPFGDPVLDAAFEKDFRVAPTQGTIAPYQEMPITISYTATDRRPAPLFRAQASKEAEEKLLQQAGLPASPRAKLPGFGKYPNRRSPTALDASTKNNKQTHAEGDEGDDEHASSSSSPRGRSVGATSSRSNTSARGPPPFPVTSRSASPTKRTNASMSAQEIAESYSRAPPALDVFTSRLALIVPELQTITGIDVIGRAIRPMVHVSTTHIEFGQIAVNGRADAVITLRNDSELLPVSWHCEKLSNYFTSPSHGKIDPLQEVSITVSFVPTRLGPANLALPLIIRPGNGKPMQEPSKYILRENTGEPPQKGAKNARVAMAATDPANMLTIPLALTALAIAPAQPMLPGNIHLPGTAGGAMTQGALGVGLASQFGSPGYMLATGGVVGGGVALTLGDEGGKPIPPGTVAPTGSVTSTILTPFDGAAGVTGTANVAALSNATGPNAMRSVFRRSGALAERYANMPPHLLRTEHVYVDQYETEHSSANVMAIGRTAFVVSDTNAVEIAEERDRAEVKGQATITSSGRANAWLQVATQRGLQPEEYATERKYTYNVSELQAKTEHTAKYNEFIATQVDKRRAARALVLLAKRGHGSGAVPKWDDPVSSGMEDSKLALREPVLHLPDASKETLWLQRPTGPDGRPMLREGGHGAASAKLNPDKLVKVKFKPFPTTAAEKLDCARLLSEEELAAVVCGPNIVPIGRINVRETRAKSFGVFNGLPSPVLVQLQLPQGVPELYQSTPLSQVVPPGQVAGFDLVFFAESEQEFKAPVSYIINTKHAARFSVTATALPIEILLSKDDISLRFADSSLETYVSESIRMTNPGKADAEFFWRIRDTDAPFEIEPVNGVLSPGEVTNAIVTYRPAYKCLTESIFSLAIRGGRTGNDAPHFVVSGEDIDARVNLSVKNIDYGRIGVGLKVSQTVTLRNTGASNGVFYISERLPKYITVTPMSGKIDPMDAIDLKVTICAAKVCILDPTQAGIAITIRAGKSLYLPISAVVIMPDIVVMENELNFNGITVGNRGKRRLTLMNKSPIHCELTVNFSQHPRFVLRPPKTNTRRGGADGGGGGGANNHGTAGDDDEDDVSLAERSMFKFDEDDDDAEKDDEEDESVLKSSAAAKKKADLATTSSKDDKSKKSKSGDEEDVEEDADESSANNDIDVEEEDEDDELLGRRLPLKFKVKMAPEQVLPFDLYYKPKEVGTEAFNLPIVVAGIRDGTLPGVERLVSATALAPRIKVESMLIDFEQRTFHRNPERRLPYPMRFKIYNTDTADVAWRADVSNLAPYVVESPNPVFTFTPSSGVVPFGEEQEIEVTFTAQAAREYTNFVPIFLEGDAANDNDGEPYIEMELRAKGVPPTLSFDRREVVLPAVPLGGTATGVFHILNHGYDHCDLTFRVPSNEITSAVNVPLRVSFPEGNTVSISTTRLPVHVELKADKASAFTSLIEFTDSDGERYVIPVSGVTDNSILTIYPYLDAHRSELYVEALQDKSPALVASARPTDALSTRNNGPGKPNAPHAPAFPSKETLSRAASMVPQPGSLPPTLPIAVAEEGSTFSPPPAATTSHSSHQQSTSSLPSSGGAAGGTAIPPTTTTAIALQSDFSHLPSASHANYAGLVKWLNTCALRTPIQHWPQDVAKAYGKPIFDMIEALSGKQIPGRIRATVGTGKRNAAAAQQQIQTPSNKKERCVHLFRQNSEFLTHMKVTGAFVHEVRPEYLLPLDEYVYVRKNMKKGWFGPVFGAPEKEVFKMAERKAKEKRDLDAFPALSLHAWSTVTLQAIRVFSLSRVTMRALVNTAGMFMDSESKSRWDELVAQEADVNVRIQAAKQAAGMGKGVSLAERPSVGDAIKKSLADGSGSSSSGNSTARSGSGGGSKSARSGAGASGSGNTTAANSGGTTNLTTTATTMNGLDAGNSYFAEFNGPKPTARVEASIMLSNTAATPSNANAIPPITTSRSTRTVTASAEAAAAAAAPDPKVADAALMAEFSLVKKAIAEFLKLDASLDTSNIMSSPELLLLRWLSYHYNRMNPSNSSSSSKNGHNHNNSAPPRRFVDFGGDLSDGSVFLYLLLSHVPELGRPGKVLDIHSGNVHTNPTTPKQIRENCIAICKALTELGLTPPFTPEDLCPTAFKVEEMHGGSSIMSDDAFNAGFASVMSNNNNKKQDPMTSFLDAQMTMLKASINAGVNAEENNDATSSKQNAKKKKAAAAATTGGASKTQKGGATDSFGATGERSLHLGTASVPLTSAEKNLKPSRPLFTPETQAIVANRLPGTQRVRLGAAHTRDMVLWSLWFWTNLPQQVPRTVVDFRGPLHGNAQKSIILTNPTRKPITYDMTLEGASCFGTAHGEGGGSGSGANNKNHTTDRSRTIVLEANSSLSFGVTCQPKFSRPSHGKLVFRSKAEGITSPSVLVFALRSIITSRPPASVKSITGPLYVASSIDIDVKNSGVIDGDFTVTVLHTDPSTPRGQNISQAEIAKVIEENPSEYAISADGTLPYFLRSEFVPPVLHRDDEVAAKLSSMDATDLAMYGLTGEDAAAMISTSGGGGRNNGSMTGGNNTKNILTHNGSSMSSGGHDGDGVVDAASIISGLNNHINNNNASSSSSVASNDPAELPTTLAGAVGRGKTHSLPDPFWCKYREMRLKAGQTKRLAVQFLPFKPGPHRVTIIVCDKNSEIMETVYEIDGTAEIPYANAVKLATRAPISKTVERLLFVPTLNPAKEFAYDATIDRLDRRMRPYELANRESTRAEEAALRERALAGVRKIAMGGGGSKMMLSAQQKQSLKTAAAIMLGTFYEVSVDSPFFDVPKRIYVPAPSRALPGAGAAGPSSNAVHPHNLEKRRNSAVGTTSANGGDGAGARRDSLTSVADSHHLPSSNAIELSASVIGMTQAALETIANPIAPFAKDNHGNNTGVPTNAMTTVGGGGEGSIVAAGNSNNDNAGATSIASIEIPSDTAASHYRPLAAPAAVVDALASAKAELLNCLSRVPLICRPKGAGVYTTNLTLTSDRDVRVYKVEVAVEAPLPIRSITFNTPVDKPVTQKLPVHNPTTHDIVFNTTLAPVRRNIDASSLHFAVPTSVSVRAGATVEFPVTFSPESLGDELATLILLESGQVNSKNTSTTGNNGSAPELPVRVGFDLRGVGNDPLALDTLILNTPVRSETTKTVIVYNYSRSDGPLTYQMETDIPYLQGPQTITVPPATVGGMRGSYNNGSSGVPLPLIPGQAKYTFTFTPSVGGDYMGQLLFTDPRTGKYQWYAIEASATGGEPMARVSVSTTVRKAVAVEIALSNPTDLEIALDVNLYGEGLVGEPVFILAPGETRAYELVYAPLVPTNDGNNNNEQQQQQPVEGIVTFSAPSVGELTYALDLLATPAPPVSLPAITAAIGASTTVFVTLENPTSVEGLVRGVVSNGRNYAIDNVLLSKQGALSSVASGSLISVPPFSSRKVPITYTPSTMGNANTAAETCTVQLTSTQLGEWTYYLSGTGTAPTPAPVQTVTAVAHSTVSASVPFRNPFPAPLTITAEIVVVASGEIGIDGDGSKTLKREHTGAGEDMSVPVLTLLRTSSNNNNKSTTTTLPPFGSTAIPFSFSPSTIAETIAVVNVSGRVNFGAAAPSLNNNTRNSNNNNNNSTRNSMVELSWVFPLRAVGEAPISKKVISLKSKARSRSSIPISLPLAGWAPPPAVTAAAAVAAASSTTNHASHSHHHHNNNNKQKGGTATTGSTGTEFTVEIVPFVSDDDVARALTQLQQEAAGIGGGGGGSMTSGSVLNTRKSRLQQSTTAGGGATATATASELAATAKATALAKLSQDISRALTLIPKKTTLYSASEEVMLEARLKAHKPLDCRAEIVVSKAAAGGGSWRFPVRIVVGAAPVDDTLQVSSAINTSSTMSFTLSNVFPRPAAYKAYFSLDSPGEFRVSPSSGLLPSSSAHLYSSDADEGGSGNNNNNNYENGGGEGGGGLFGGGGGSSKAAEIAITFTPRGYGQQQYVGKLFVETEEMLWTYTVQGTLPAYVPPSVSNYTVDDRLSGGALATLRASHSTANRRQVVGEYLATYIPPHEPAAGVFMPMNGTGNTILAPKSGGSPMRPMAPNPSVLHHYQTTQQVQQQSSSAGGGAAGIAFASRNKASSSNGTNMVGAGSSSSSAREVSPPPLLRNNLSDAAGGASLHQQQQQQRGGSNNTNPPHHHAPPEEHEVTRLALAKNIGQKVARGPGVPQVSPLRLQH